MDDLDSGHLWHLELRDDEVDRALVSLLNRELHDEFEGVVAAREKMYLAINICLLQKQLHRLQIHVLIINHHDDFVLREQAR